MKTFALVALSALAVSASAFANPVRSLNDLPSKWEGVAGDLVTRTQASLILNKITGITRHPGNVLNVTYDVDATFSLGQTQLKIIRMNLRSTYGYENSYELSIFFDDPLVYSALATIRYDEATHSYTMLDVMQGGTRQFALKGVK